MTASRSTSGSGRTIPSGWAAAISSPVKDWWGDIPDVHGDIRIYTRSPIQAGTGRNRAE